MAGTDGQNIECIFEKTKELHVSAKLTKVKLPSLGVKPVTQKKEYDSTDKRCQRLLQMQRKRCLWSEREYC